MILHNQEPNEELTRITAELQNIITAEEIEIELLQHATGITAQVAISIRSEMVTRLKKVFSWD